MFWQSRLLFPGQGERPTFRVLEVPGDDPFVCTYPGHWRVMDGVMRVVADLADGAQTTRHVLEPSLQLSEGHERTMLDLDDESSIVGRVVEEDREHVHVVERLLQPDEVTLVLKEAIVESRPPPLSPMPTGLLATLEEDEVLDLLAFVEQLPSEVGVEDEDPELWPTLAGGQGPGAGTHVVLVAGDEEYRSEEGMPMLARILARHYGFRCTALSSTEPGTGEIDPEEQTHIPGMHLLDEADMVVCFLRFRELPDEDMAHVVRYVDRASRSSASAPRPTRSASTAMPRAPTPATATTTRSGRVDSVSRSWAKPGSRTGRSRVSERPRGDRGGAVVNTRSCAVLRTCGVRPTSTGFAIWTSGG